MTADPQFLADLQAVRARISAFWDLYEFLGKTDRGFLVGQTILAAVVNLERYGEPFSYLGVMAGEYHGAYRYLVKHGYFAEGHREGRPVILPTRKLLDALLGFFSMDRETR